jgi:hypothetical protein
LGRPRGRIGIAGSGPRHREGAASVEWNQFSGSRFLQSRSAVRLRRARHMNGIIYLVGLIVVIMAILSFFGLR